MSRPVSISSGPSLVGSFVNGVQNAAARALAVDATSYLGVTKNMGTYHHT